MTSQRRRWKPREINDLYVGYEVGFSWEELSEIHNRTPFAIRKQFSFDKKRADKAKEARKANGHPKPTVTAAKKNTFKDIKPQVETPQIDPRIDDRYRFLQEVDRQLQELDRKELYPTEIDPEVVDSFLDQAYRKLWRRDLKHFAAGASVGFILSGGGLIAAAIWG